MRIINKHYSGRNHLNNVHDPESMCDTFPWMNGHLRAIATMREVNTALLARTKVLNKNHAIKRKLAIIPFPAFSMLSHEAPEVVANDQLMRQFLKDNPHYLVVPRESL